MEYIRSNEIDPQNTLFHFSRIDNRKSIEEYGLQAVAGGENEAANDDKNKTIYFSKGIAGFLKAVDVWARWEYNKYARQEHSKGHEIKQEYEEHIIEGKDDSYDKDIMTEVIFKKLYIDFKNRQYYMLDLIEGKDGDFEYGDIDAKKVLSRDEEGRPYLGVLWMYGPYSDFGTLDNPNNNQEQWNMNTKLGDRTISPDRLKIIETQEGRSDGLSVIIEAYDKYRGMVPKQDDEMFEIVDNFIAYAKERYKNDRDFKESSIDYGKRDINADKQKEYQIINQINLKKPKKNRLFSFISKIINKIKSTAKRKDIKILPEAVQDIREESSTKSNSINAFLESLRVSPEKLAKNFERKKVISAADRFIKDIRDLPSEIKDNTIILIGPMGTGKSTIAKLLADKIQSGERLAVDSRGQFEELYKKEKSFRNFKNFEFTLIGTILSSLKTPCVIDFGAGHSVYEDSILRAKMQEICSQFKNIILLLPSKDNETSRRVLLERRNFKPGSHKDKDNWHFITAPNNYELATDIIYEEGKSPEEISEEILERINQKNRNVNTSRDEI